MSTIRSKVTEPVPGLTKDKAYKFISWGFYRGAYFTIVNDRGEQVNIYDPKKYLHTEDLEDPRIGCGLLKRDLES